VYFKWNSLTFKVILFMSNLIQSCKIYISTKTLKFCQFLLKSEKTNKHINKPSKQLNFKFYCIQLFQIIHPIDVLFILAIQFEWQTNYNVWTNHIKQYWYWLVLNWLGCFNLDYNSPITFVSLICFAIGHI
jgi:hypothetical protein